MRKNFARLWPRARRRIQTRTRHRESLRGIRRIRRHADWNEEAVRADAGELAAQGHKPLAIRCDGAKDAEVEARIAQTVATFAIIF